MKGTIYKIDDLKEALKYKGIAFKRVYFEMEDKSWAKTDIVPTFRNYPRWKDLLVVGNIIGGLKLLNPKTVDADSFPILIKKSV